MSKTYVVNPGTVVETKRLYLPGVKIQRRCPGCQGHVYWSDRHDYVSYPTIGRSITIVLFCEECETRIPVQIVLGVTVTEVG